MPASGGSEPAIRIRSHRDHPEDLFEREWLVTNRLGGFASCTVAGPCTRRYHGMLVAALPAPIGRAVMVDHVWERVALPAGPEHSLEPPTPVALTLELGLPAWSYDLEGGVVLEKRVVMPRMQNTVYVQYVLRGAVAARLELRPGVHARPLETPVSAPLFVGYRATDAGPRLEIAGPEGFPPLRLHVEGGGVRFIHDARVIRHVQFAMEARRGYDAEGDLWCPGTFEIELLRDQPVTFRVSVEPWEVALVLPPEDAFTAELARRRRLLASANPAARTGLAAHLVIAADDFVFMPAGRIEGTVRARADGDDFCSIVAGYHWFGDWGRDAMIGLEGLLLVTGRHVEAAHVLTSFARYVRDGLVPNMFPEGSTAGRYNSADATLWFIHALDRYVAITGDRQLLVRLLPIIRDIIAHYREGTRHGIRIDPDDGLLVQGDPHEPVTWMDAQLEGRVLTPRRGKAVEINALWYNALVGVGAWLGDEVGDGASREVVELAERVHRAFNARFWCEARQHLYDVVDGDAGDDPACRPNQIFAMSLPHPVLARERCTPVFAVVTDRLLTPYGLRSLAPGELHFHPRYFGDVHARDEAYHQGTVWPWLLGPYVDARLRLFPDDREGARALLRPFEAHLADAGVGSVSEIFDAEPPFTPRGCIAQAWSVAELLRAWIKTAPSDT